MSDNIMQWREVLTEGYMVKYLQQLLSGTAAAEPEPHSRDIE